MMDITAIISSTKTALDIVKVLKETNTSFLRSPFEMGNAYEVRVYFIDVAKSLLEFTCIPYYKYGTKINHF